MLLQKNEYVTNPIPTPPLFTASISKFRLERYLERRCKILLHLSTFRYNASFSRQLEDVTDLQQQCSINQAVLSRRWIYLNLCR